MRPRKRFGQHFLESVWARKVVDLIAPQRDDTIVEIGPGRGALTLPLAKRTGHLLVIEVDRDLAATLGTSLPGHVQIITADVLKADLSAEVQAWRGQPIGPEQRVRVVGNLPYNISSPILFRLLNLSASTGGLVDAVLMLQREVAERVIAGPGGKEYGVLSVLTAVHADATRLLNLPPGAFRPAPKVQSTVIHLRFRPAPVPVASPERLTAMVRSVFGQRRKTLANSLAAFALDHGTAAPAALALADIDPRRRPETLTLAEFARLAAVFGQKPA